MLRALLAPPAKLRFEILPYAFFFFFVFFPRDWFRRLKGLLWDVFECYRGLGFRV